MKRTSTLALAALLLATPAMAQQRLYNNGAGFRYGPPMQRGWLAPRPSYLQGYVRPYRPNPGIPVGAILGGVLGAFGAAALAQVPPPPMPMAAPPDAMDEIAPVNPQGVTRAEVEGAIEDFCSRNATASLCVKLQGQPPIVR